MKYKNNIRLESKPKAQVIKVKNSVAVYPTQLDSGGGIERRTYLQFVRKWSMGISLFRAKKDVFFQLKNNWE